MRPFQQSLPSIRYWQDAAGNCIEETACKSLISPLRVSPHILLLLLHHHLNLSSHFLLCVFSLLSHLVVHPKCGLTFQRVAPLGVNNETWVCVCERERDGKRESVCVYVRALFGGMTFLYNGRDFKLKCLSECVFLRIQWLKNTSLESFVLISLTSTRQLNKQMSTFLKKKKRLLWLQRMSGIIGVGGGPFPLRSLRASSGLKPDFFRIIWISKLTFSAKCFPASLPPTHSVFSC